MSVVNWHLDVLFRMAAHEISEGDHLIELVHKENFPRI